MLSYRISTRGVCVFPPLLSPRCHICNNSSLAHNQRPQDDPSDIRAQLQYQRNSDVIKNLNILAEEDNTEDDVEPTTCISKGTLKRTNVPEYISLTHFNDSVSKVPELSHNLASTLFSPGVHYMTDPRTNHFNFDKSLTNIPHIDTLKMDKISHFTPSSRDTKLLDIANTLNKRRLKKHPHKKAPAVKFFSSTSSMTSVLIKFHKYLSHNRPINTTSFSKFYPDATQFTRTSDVPTSLVVTPKDDDKQIYSLDADRSTDSEITLSILGNALELMLTKPSEEFQKFLKSSKEVPKDDSSAYHYAKIGKFLVRSQLDAVDTRLPGTGTFDIKTRAVCAIRFDLSHTDYFPTNYEINKTYGLFESFERELFDAARIVMFKYSLQARLGNMDGIFMAFHNIKKFLGFQYLPLTDIDNIFFGEYSILGKKYGQKILDKTSEEANAEEVNTSNQLTLKNIVNDFGNHHQTKREVLSSFVADYELRLSMNLLEALLENIVKDTKGKPFRIIFKKIKSNMITPPEPKPVEATDTETPKENITETKTASEKLENMVKPDSTAEELASTSGAPDSIVVIVNTLEKEELNELQMLTQEKLEQSKQIVKNAQNNKSMSPSDRIKYFSRYVSDFRNKFFKLNRVILKNSEKEGFFAYQLQADHYFNGTKSEDKHPMPAIEILDKDSDYSWDVKYSINRINRIADKKYLYNKFIKNIAFTSFRDADSESNIDVYTDEGDVQLDENATALQNITRAYSAKALKRKELSKSNQ
ncbi:hypothetical protein PICMEDRAFT_15438 [Pichia membranifaciens NRRL Y-2026]|uniref:Uncharacterized protein n=1 Tax=Pichia membranifaciens NRRL Y-2026 TaxID=763406 RepID=A0A1E3NN17_9ASCO|nr:hypothetical protein PICMEDRAFT_15438 [Pichia membranifaciens NRRL Y-2026]ODQ47499.1 hypothetical protein PICMEDRAFT_15438 [Pichia membranifaciens NRRL Y-2026]